MREVFIEERKDICEITSKLGKKKKKKKKHLPTHVKPLLCNITTL